MTDLDKQLRARIKSYCRAISAVDPTSDRFEEFVSSIYFEAISYHKNKIKSKRDYTLSENSNIA